VSCNILPTGDATPHSHLATGDVAIMQLTSTGFVCMLENRTNSFMPINPYVTKLLHVQTISLNYFLGNESVVTNKN
jgi:hypothetical protein